LLVPHDLRRKIKPLFLLATLVIASSLVAPFARAQTVVATVPLPVGSHPAGIAYDSAKGEVFVANDGSNTVSVISDSTNTVVATVSVGSGPFGVAYDSAKGEVFVTNIDSDTVSVISDGTSSSTTTQIVCNPGTVAVNQATQCTATVTDTSPTPTSPTGTVSFSSSSSGTFSATSCTLASASASTSSCSVTYTPSPGSEGTHVVTGTYSGDPTHSGSMGMTSLTVTKRTTSTSVSCSVAFLTDHHATPCTATVTDTSPGTPITPSGTVAWTSSGGGTFSSNPCALSGAGPTATCTVTYTASPGRPLPRTISGTYSGDTDHFGSSGTTPITTP